MASESASSSASTFSFAAWPPAFTPAQLDELTLRATTYALAHGLLYLPASTPPPPAPTSAIHAPISLVPAPLPRSLFARAQRLQPLYNALYARIALDVEFLDEVMGAEVGVGQVDEFVGQLWRGWKAVRDGAAPDKLHLGLFRSDYLLHTGGADGLSLKQVEFNTISSSFGTLAERTAGLHRHLVESTGYFGASPYLTIDNLPPNETTAALVDGLAFAHQAYKSVDAEILFVVQAGERNVFDQRWLEYELLEKHKIRVMRQTFDELAHTASLSDTGALIVTPTPDTPREISVVYFRAGYTDTDYPSPTVYETRAFLERSRAINCPSIPLQLAGGKKVQEVLARPGVLERFTEDSGVFSAEDVALLRESWMGMWGLDATEVAGAPAAAAGISAGVSAARARAEGLVLKPQREGGGNNVYRGAIPAFLDALPPAERAAWIAMELIVPPVVGGHLLRAGTGAALRADVVSELGVFGWALFSRGEVVAREAGWLVRTKGRESDEGGVATGFSVLDSVVLVDG